MTLSTYTGPSRRTLIGAATWTAPAIAFAVASPTNAVSTPSPDTLGLDASAQVPVNSTFDVEAVLARVSGSLAAQSVAFTASPATVRFPSGTTAVTNSAGSATVTATAPATVGPIVITATIAALNLTTTITIQVPGFAIYTAQTPSDGWRMTNVGIADAQVLAVGSGYYWALENGVAYQLTSDKARWKVANAPGPIARLEVRPNNGGYAAAIGADGSFSQMSDGNSFVATPGVTGIVQVSTGGSRWWVRTSDGEIYFNPMTSTGSRAQWTRVTTPSPAVALKAYPFDATEYVIIQGADGLVYTSSGRAAFRAHMQGLPLGVVPKKVSVEQNHYSMLDADGTFYQTASAGDTAAFARVTSPVPLATYSAYEANAVYVHAIGTDGNPYQRNGANFFRKPGTPDGQVVAVVIGSGTWTARTSTGDVYYTNTSNTVGGSSANGTYTLINGARGITLHDSYYAGNYIVAVAPAP